jgi:large subunit ribosomal protein L6
MSRLAKKPIPIPEKAEATLSLNTLTVKGPAGTLVRAFHSSVVLAVADNEIRVSSQSGAPAEAHLGTSVAHIQNMLRGVCEPFVKKLIVEGIGFKAEVKGSEIVFALGFSHPVQVSIPQNIKVTAEKNIITISGADIEQVGQFAARLRALKKPEPYKGKGIRYEGEVIRRKQGKKTV